MIIRRNRCKWYEGAELKALRQAEFADDVLFKQDLNRFDGEKKTIRLILERHEVMLKIKVPRTCLCVYNNTPGSDLPGAETGPPESVDQEELSQPLAMQPLGDSHAAKKRKRQWEPGQLASK